MSEQANTATVQQAYAAFGRGDIPALLATLDDNIDWHPVIGAGPEVPTSGTRRGHKQVAEFFQALGKSVAMSLFEPREFIAQGDSVAVVGRYAAKAIPTGRTYEAPWVMIFTFRNGKIVTFREFSDSAAINAAFAGAARKA